MADTDWKICQKTRIKPKLYDPQLICLVGVINEKQFDSLLSKALTLYQKSESDSRSFNYYWIYKPLFDTDNQHTGYGLVWVNHPSLSWLLLGLQADGQPSNTPNPNQYLENKIQNLEAKIKTCNWQEKPRLQIKIKKLHQKLCSPLRLESPEYDKEQIILISHLKHVQYRLFSIAGWVKPPNDISQLYLTTLYSKIPKDMMMAVKSDISQEYLIFHSPNHQKKKLGPEVKFVTIKSEEYVIMKFSSADRAIFAYNLKPRYLGLIWNYISLELYHQYN